MILTIKGFTHEVADQEEAEAIIAHAEEFQGDEGYDMDAFEKWAHDGFPMGITADQIEETTEQGKSWGEQEAEAQIEAIENGHLAVAPPWNSGTGLERVPKFEDDEHGEKRRAYRDAVNAAAQTAYEAAIAAWEVAK